MHFPPRSCGQNGLVGIAAFLPGPEVEFAWRSAISAADAFLFFLLLAVLASPPQRLFSSIPSVPFDRLRWAAQ